MSTPPGDFTHALPAGLAASLAQRYSLLGLLGEGGFGQVFHARQLATGQEVAIKVLRLRRHAGAVAPAKQITRFRRELDLCARLYHPHIVRPLDCGEGEADLIYTVFGLIPGRNLAETLAAEGSLSPTDAIRLLGQVLDALHCAHRAGVIHRDLKPENIMISHTGALPSAQVLDFGIGVLTEDGDGAGRLTEPHESLGSPAYAAPEQLRGETVSAATDIYAWGLVFLECLQGSPAMAGGGLSEVLYRQLGPEPVPLPASLRDTPLGQLLARVTAKEPAERPTSIPALLTELDEIALQWRLAERLPEPTARIRLSVPTMPLPLRELASHLGGAMDSGERRQLTALCCEMVLERRAGEELEMEELDALLREQRTLCLRVVDNAGGFVAGVLGDRLLVYFGYPRAAEDDPRRAARCALELTRALAERDRTLLDARGVNCRFGIGLHTGLVIVPGSEDPGGVDLSLGQTPELSARLAGAAPPGGVLLSETVEPLLDGRFACEAAGEQRLAGASRPLRLYRLRDVGGTAGAVSGRAGIPLVGRTTERELLARRWRQARDGEGQTLLLVGEPGVGKTRLVAAAREDWQPVPGTWLECRCAFENRDRPLRPLVELLGEWLREHGERDLTTLEAQLGRHGFHLAETVPVLAELLELPTGERYPPLTAAPERRRELMEQTLLTLFCELAEREPRVLFVEDLHWADPSTLALLEQLLEDVPTMPLLLLCTARPEFTPGWPAGRFRQLRLEGLGSIEVAAMVVALAGGRELAGPVQAMILERTDGVALFVEELTLLLLESAALAVRDGVVVLTRPPEELMIPDSLRGLLTARLDRLGAARETAQLAAAIGREFPLELLAAVSPRSAETLDRDLAALVAADLVYRRRRHRHPSFVFRHALIRDTAYQSMLQATRQQVHRRICGAIENRLPELAAARPDLLAHHHAEGGQLPQALGYAEAAGQAALARSANREALAQVHRALDWLAALAEPAARAAQELRLNSIATPALMALEGYTSPQLADFTRRSLALIDQLGDVPQAFPTLWAVATYHHVRAERREARQLAERLVGLSERTGEQGQWLAARTHLGQCLLVEGRFREAEQLLAEVIQHYPERLDPAQALRYGLDTLAYRHMTLARVLGAQGRFGEALAEARRGVARSHEIQHVNSEALALLYLMNVYRQRGEYSEVATVGTRILALCETHGLGFMRSLAGLLLACGAGDLGRARAIVAEHEARMIRLGFAYYGGLVAETALGQGETEAALALVERCLDEVARTGECYYLATLQALKGEVLAARGEPAAGLDWCRRGLTTAGEQGADGFRLRIATTLVRLEQAAGESSGVRAVLAALCRQLAREADCPALISARKVLAGGNEGSD